MILRPWVVVFSLAFTGAAHAVEKDAYAVPKYKIGKVSAIKVTSASIHGDYDPKEDCTSFQMTPKKARFFMSHANPISPHAAANDYTFTSCYSEGTVKFVNGVEAIWLINHGGTGSMSLKSGVKKGELINLHCQRCDDMDM